MARLGLGYDDLSAVNPRLIYASTSGFGHTGPYQHRPAVDVIVQGMGGVMSITGHPGGPPARPGYSIGDMAGGMYTAIGVARRDARAGVLRTRPARRRRHARRPSRAARERRRPGGQHRRSPRPDRHAPPLGHAVPGLPHPRWLDGDRRSQGLAALLHQDRARRPAPRRAFPDQPRPHRPPRRSRTDSL